MTIVDYAEQKTHWEGIRNRRPPDHPVVAAFARPKIELIARALARASIEESGTVLEVGAGNGFFSKWLDERFDLICSDFSANMLGLNPIPAQRKVAADVERLCFGDDSFDVVFSANLLHHLEDPTVAVREMTRVARRHVVLIEPNVLNPLMFLFNLMKPEERGGLKFTARYMQNLGSEAGLRPRFFCQQGAVVPNRTPPRVLPALRLVDGRWPFGFYHVGVFDV